MDSLVARLDTEHNSSGASSHYFSINKEIIMQIRVSQSCHTDQGASTMQTRKKIKEENILEPGWLTDSEK